MAVNVLKLGMPKGSLQEATFELFRRAGWPVSLGERSYYPDVGDEEISAMLIRAQEMSRYVESGVLDAGITGRDWIAENESDVHVVAELTYSKARMCPVRWVLAVPETSPIQKVEDLEGKTIATELVGGVRKWLEEKGVSAEVEFSWGATEAKAGSLVDAIVDVTETGSSLRANNLRIVDTVMTSVTQFIASHAAWADEWKRKKMETLVMMIQGAIEATNMVGLKLNVLEKDYDAVLAVLERHALREPTISPLHGPVAGHAVEVVADESIVRKLIPALKEAGAEGIVEYPLNKVIY